MTDLQMGMIISNEEEVLDTAQELLKDARFIADFTFTRTSKFRRKDERFLLKYRAEDNLVVFRQYSVQNRNTKAWAEYQKHFDFIIETDNVAELRQKVDALQKK